MKKAKPRGRRQVEVGISEIFEICQKRGRERGFTRIGENIGREINAAVYDKTTLATGALLASLKDEGEARRERERGGRSDKQESQKEI